MTDKEVSIIIRLMGIRPSEWPINAYRWFGLKEGEDDPAIIEAACDDLERKLQHIVSSYNKGPSEDEKAVARALWEQSFWRKKVLQDPTLKAEYDATMKREQRYFSHVRSTPTAKRQEEPLNTTDPPLPQAPPVIEAVDSTEIATPMINTRKAASSPLDLLKRKRAKKRRQQILIRVLLTIAAITSGAILAYILLRTK